MSFAFTKLVLFLILPPAGLLILIASGFLIIKISRSVGKLMIVSGFVFLYLLSTDPVSNALMMPLEKSFPPLKNRAPKASAVVVLGGGTRDLAWIGLKPEPAEASLVRLVTGIKLHEKLRIPLLLTGGSGDPLRPELSDAKAMAGAAAGLGMTRGDIVIEHKSRNTIESAKAVRKIIKGNRIILVTSASHMRRAAAMFRKQGFDVVPAPCGYKSEKKRFSLFSLIPNANDLAVSASALHERISFSWYKGRGDIE